MSKSFTTAPKPKQPTDDQIEAFVKAGPGHDTKPAPAPVKAVDEPTVRLNVDLPVSERKRFKMACEAADTKMTTELLSFIRKRTVELEKKAGINS